MKKIILSVILFFFWGYSNADRLIEDKENVDESKAFSKLYISIEGGEKYPFGDLIDAVNNTLYGGLGVRYSYWNHVDGIIMFQYSYFEPHYYIPRINGVHEVSGKLGLDFKWEKLNNIAFGGGFLCNWTRVDYNGDKKEFSYNKDLGATLTDNETEFGWFARLNLPIIKLQNYRSGLNILWEELWTLPKRSNMLSIGLYVERRIW